MTRRNFEAYRQAAEIMTADVDVAGGPTHTRGEPSLKKIGPFSAAMQMQPEFQFPKKRRKRKKRKKKKNKRLKSSYFGIVRIQRNIINKTFNIQKVFLLFSASFCQF